MLEARQSNLRDDLVSNLIHANQAGEITDCELHNLVVTLVWAAHDTTARQWGRAIVTFAEHHGQWETLADQPALADQMVEEICRFSPQARATFRFATENSEVHGLDFPAESMVMVSIVAANRDEHVYDDPAPA